MTAPNDEMRTLFFESTTDRLQALNDDALRLEANTTDAETIRSIRRSVHTIKGDSAVMGFQELSDLAHELEDVLTPETAAANGASLAEVVLSAADMFDALLAAYQGGIKPPNGDPLRAMIWKLGQKPTNSAPIAALNPSFAWSEYDQLAIEEAASRNLTIYNIAISFAADCPMRDAGVAVLHKTMSEAGEILVASPGAEQWATAATIEVALATRETEKALTAKLQVPGVVGNLIIRNIKGSAPEAVADLVETAPKPARLKAGGENLLRVEAAKVDSVLNLVGEMVIAKSMLQQAVSEFLRQHPKDPLRGKFSDALAFQSQVLNGLQRASMGIRMVPVEQLFRRFPRLVRDVAHSCGKKIELHTEGEETELDKALIDALAEPLGHIVRNAVDHGVESPAERRAAGKPETGNIRLNAFHQGNQVVIEISDDGNGINAETVLKHAVEAGFVTAEKAARLEPEEALEFIFEPGFSTTDAITPISGRGIGMDVVKAAVQKLKGTISIDTAVGEGATFQLKLPLTLAILRAMLFRVNERLYAVPLDAVVEIRRAENSDITRAGNREVMQVRDELLTIVRLRRMDDAARDGDSKIFVVVLTVGQRKFGLVVDALVGEQELVIKPIDEKVVASDLVTGASVLGDGTVALVLNIAEAVRRYSSSSPLAPPPEATKSWGATA